MNAQPTGAPGRRQMPAFDINDEEMQALIDFLEWTDSIDTQAGRRIRPADPDSRNQGESNR
ncbi:hypothetical protein [Halomonas sp. BC04]|uniref:hypothetical protein n=1 Tax=Halomonas sp. BC04 TaxID=1403540 RepID=UPI0003ED6B3B|nr:hypothetical protein [Halomonas sp. BC04]EWG98634.1 hypothetical protein Q427_29450 [Halomonas sp. BC04]